MSMLIDYIVVVEVTNQMEFERRVKMAMNEGFQPVGGVSISWQAGAIVYAQAMGKWK